MDVARSVNGVPIRLTDERWLHIVNTHNDMAGYYDDCLGTIERPDRILRGDVRTLIAVRSYGRNRYLFVIYREVSRDDGFVVTAYFSRRIPSRRVLWRR